jgi:hypothetical protein
VNVHRYADRPDLLAIRWETLAQPAFPEYMNHNVPGNKYWGSLYDDFPDFQLALLDGEELVAELHSVPTACSRKGSPLGCSRRCEQPPAEQVSAS